MSVLFEPVCKNAGKMGWITKYGPGRCVNTYRGLTQPHLNAPDRRAVVDSTHQPRATDAESQLLDHIDILTRAAGDRPDEAADILEESLAVERRLAESRAATWLAWAHRVGLFDIYEETMRSQQEAGL